MGTEHQQVAGVILLLFQGGLEIREGVILVFMGGGRGVCAGCLTARSAPHARYLGVQLELPEARLYLRAAAIQRSSLLFSGDGEGESTIEDSVVSRSEMKVGKKTKKPKMSTIRCPQCKQDFKVPKTGRAQHIKCPECGLEGEMEI